MNKWAELLIGLILVNGAIYLAWISSSPDWGAFWNFKHAAWEFLKGGVFWFIVMIGALFILLGISDLKG
ncbi:MAG: hypothetical protein KJ600_04760 [Nanoarchaeota archaeon]|nr:hypothetical protein [Nanoarchaeota archaeon]MBU1103840.1 hypothetical protein [Nanoarchaeota archaeon]